MNKFKLLERVRLLVPIKCWCQKDYCTYMRNPGDDGIIIGAYVGSDVYEIYFNNVKYRYLTCLVRAEHIEVADKKHELS